MLRAFVEGYQQVRPLSRNKQDAIPLLDIISVIWVMAIHVYNNDRMGHKCLEKPFRECRLKRVGELGHRYLDIEQR